MNRMLWTQNVEVKNSVERVIKQERERSEKLFLELSILYICRQMVFCLLLSSSNSFPRSLFFTVPFAFNLSIFFSLLKLLSTSRPSLTVSGAKVLEEHQLWVFRKIKCCLSFPSLQSHWFQFFLPSCLLTLVLVSVCSYTCMTLTANFSLSWILQAYFPFIINCFILR